MAHQKKNNGILSWVNCVISTYSGQIADFNRLKTSLEIIKSIIMSTDDSDNDIHNRAKYIIDCILSSDDVLTVEQVHKIQHDSKIKYPILKTRKKMIYNVI